MTKSFYRKLYTSPVVSKNDLYDDLFFPEGTPEGSNTLGGGGAGSEVWNRVYMIAPGQPPLNTLILDVLEQQECGGPLTETECWEV